MACSSLSTCVATRRSLRPFSVSRRTGAIISTIRAGSRRWLVAALLLGACGRRAPAARPAGLAFTDDAGRTVTLPAVAHRVVSLNPAFTELLFAVQAGASVVGRTHYDDYPAEALAVADMGVAFPPNVEQVLAVHPDLVLLLRTPQNAEAQQRLLALGVPTLQLDSDLLREVPRLARLFGAWTGHAASGDSVARAFEAELARATVAPAGARPRVLLVAWDQPPMAIGGGSFLSELVARAGGENVFADLPQPAATVSLESMAARAPDVLVTLSDGTPAFASRPEWQAIGAVRERRFVRAGGSMYMHPGPRSPEAVRALAAALVGAAR